MDQLPVYQAHLKGAAALIAVQSGGYGEIDDEALNAQDIAGPEDAPAFSISRKDSDPLKELLEHTQEITVTWTRTAVSPGTAPPTTL